MDHMSVLMYNMLCSVHYFHSANLVHRDIKPSNFLMNLNCIPKLCDFGLARTVPKKKYDFTYDSTQIKDSDSESLQSVASTVNATVIGNIINKNSKFR